MATHIASLTRPTAHSARRLLSEYDHAGPTLEIADQSDLATGSRGQSRALATEVRARDARAVGRQPGQKDVVVAQRRGPHRAVAEVDRAREVAGQVDLACRVDADGCDPTPGTRRRSVALAEEMVSCGIVLG